jgi:hypothetical protein
MNRFQFSGFSSQVNVTSDKRNTNMRGDKQQIGNTIVKVPRDRLKISPFFGALAPGNIFTDLLLRLSNENLFALSLTHYSLLITHHFFFNLATQNR